MLIEDSEYKVLEPNQDLQKRKEYWAVAKGLQRIDGFQTSYPQFGKPSHFEKATQGQFPRLRLNICGH